MSQTVDALSFHSAVERAARTIQDRFRYQKSLKEATSATCDENDASDLEMQDEEDEDKEEPKDRSSLYTAIFIAIFGFGFFVWNLFQKCLPKGDASDAVDGNDIANAAKASGTGAPSPPP